MSYTSKFTERFDIHPSESMIQEPTAPSSPRLSSVYSSPDLVYSDTSLNNHHSLIIASTVKPIAIPQKKNKSISATPPNSPPQSTEKHHDAIASKFKNFLSTISKKRNRSTSIGSLVTTTISTK
jgi:hypothetical protein